MAFTGAANDDETAGKKEGPPRLAKAGVFAIPLPPGSDADSELILVVHREWPGTSSAPRKWERGTTHLCVVLTAS